MVPESSGLGIPAASIRQNPPAGNRSAGVRTRPHTGRASQVPRSSAESRPIAGMGTKHLDQKNSRSGSRARRLTQWTWQRSIAAHGIDRRRAAVPGAGRLAPRSSSMPGAGDGRSGLRRTGTSRQTGFPNSRISRSFVWPVQAGSRHRYWRRPAPGSPFWTIPLPSWRWTGR